MAEELLRPQNRKIGTGRAADPVFFVYGEAVSCPRMDQVFSENR